MKKWKIISGILSILLAAAVLILGHSDVLIIISQVCMLAGGILALAASRLDGTALRRMNACLIGAYGLAVCIGLYNHAGLWLFTVAAVWSVICCLAACFSIAIHR